jgi:hypothetical protein
LLPNHQLYQIHGRSETPVVVTKVHPRHSDWKIGEHVTINSDERFGQTLSGRNHADTIQDIDHAVDLGISSSSNVAIYLWRIYTIQEVIVE